MARPPAMARLRESYRMYCCLYVDDADAAAEAWRALSCHLDCWNRPPMQEVEDSISLQARSLVEAGRETATGTRTAPDMHLLVLHLDSCPVLNEESAITSSAMLGCPFAIRVWSQIPHISTHA